MNADIRRSVSLRNLINQLRERKSADQELALHEICRWNVNIY